MHYEQPAETRGKEFLPRVLPYLQAAQQCRYSIAHLTIDPACVFRGVQSHATNTAGHWPALPSLAGPDLVTAVFGLAYEMVFAAESTCKGAFRFMPHNPDAQKKENSTSSGKINLPIQKETAGAVAGAAVGSVAGPIGALVGGVVGAIAAKPAEKRVPKTAKPRQMTRKRTKRAKSSSKQSRKRQTTRKASTKSRKTSRTRRKSASSRSARKRRSGRKKRH